MKPFKNLEEQIAILKERNLNFINPEKAMEYLLYNNYYNVINCYSKFFLDNNEKYIEHTNFEDIIQVHHFDKEIKSILFKYTMESEKTFRAIFAYRYSEKFKNIPYAYFDINNYDQSNILAITRSISQFSNIISTNKNESEKRKASNSISHYHTKHKDVPIWVLINNMTFGQSSKLYSVMPVDLKNKISKDLSYFLKINANNQEALLSTDQLESYLLNMVELRNIIAHNNKLIGYHCRKNNKYNPFLHDPYSIEKTAPRSDVYNVMISMQCFLTAEEYAQLNNSIKKRMEKLKKNINKVSALKVLKELGLPNEIKGIEQKQ